MAFSKGDVGLSGRMGNRVYRQVDGETIVSAMPEGVDPRTPKQVASRRHLTQATRLWGELPLGAIERWRLYALHSHPSHSPRGGKRSTRGDLVFRGLAAKYLQLHGGTSVPTEPPASPFTGDGIVVTVSADDAVVFTASGANSPGVVTELLLQRLAARHRKPQPDAYRTQNFVAFAGEPVRVEAYAGAWACAVRFVRADTGQVSALLPLGIVEIQ